MPRKAKNPKKTAQGKSIPRAMNRVAFAQVTLSDHTYARTRQMIMERFEVSEATASRDIAEAQKLFADDAEKERPYLRARETARLNRIADSAEDAGEYHAAVAASRGLSKLNGLEVDVISSGPLDPGQQAMVSAMTMTPVQRQRRIAELKAKAAAARAASKVKPKAAEDPPSEAAPDADQ